MGIATHKQCTAAVIVSPELRGLEHTQHRAQISPHTSRSGYPAYRASVL